MLHSIVIPVYNEAVLLDVLFQRMLLVINRLEGNWEVILVNDGSVDHSAELLEQIHERDPRFKVLHLSRNFGHQAAVLAGLRWASGATVTTIDADLQDPPEVIAQLFEKWKQGFEVVYAVRKKRDGESMFKLVTASVFYRVLRVLTQVEIPVDVGDFRLLDRRALEALLSMPERTNFLRGISAWIGFRQCGVPYERNQRFGGSTHYSLRKMLHLASDGITSMSAVPLRFATILGVLFFCVAIGALALRLIAVSAFSVVNQIPVMNLLIAACQLFAIGILGEYIARIYRETQGRPPYFVSRSKGFHKENAKNSDIKRSA